MNEEQEIIKELETLCGHPTLYVSQYFREVDGNQVYVVSVSNASPVIDADRHAIWNPKDIAVDIYFNPNVTLENVSPPFLSQILHWTRLICTVLTFKGHEVFLDGELFKPYE